MLDELPEGFRVVLLPQMAELVDHDVREHLGRRDDEAPREGERAAARARAPARPLVADSDRVVGETEARRLRLDGRTDPPPRLAAIPALEGDRVAGHHEP